MSQMQPDPQAMQAVLAQLGGGQDPSQEGTPPGGEPQGDWLVERRLMPYIREWSKRAILSGTTGTTVIRAVCVYL